MPEINVDVDFSVYCGICGAGCCSDTNVSKSRGHIDVTITCSSCEENIKNLEAEKSEAEQKIKELEEEIEKLKEQPLCHVL